MNGSSDWGEADLWLAELRRRHWTLHCHPNREAPMVLGAVLVHSDSRYADVVIMRGHDYRVAYRLPLYDAVDVFAPSWVCWHWAQVRKPNSATWALRIVLTLDPPPPGRDLPTYSAPPFCGIPPHERRPTIIRPL